MGKSQKLAAHPGKERSVLQEIMEELRTVDDLAHTVQNEHNNIVLVAAMYRAIVDTIPNLLEYRIDADNYTAPELEVASREAVAKATAILAVMMNWPERDTSGRNLALAAVLDVINYEGERHATVSWDVEL